MTQRGPDDMRAPEDDRLAALLAGITPDDSARTEPPPDLWAGISARVADHEEEHGRDRPPVVLSTRRQGGEGRGGHTRMWQLAAAIVVVVVAIAGVLFAVGRDSTGPSADRRLVASAELDQLEPLGATRASARLVDEAGREHLVIDAHDMPPAPEGSDYELWLIDPAVSDPRSLGTVTGSEDVVVPSTIDPAKYPIVDISLEPRDGDHQHSGHSLMRGTLR